jgi:hypothetical protein
MGVGAVGTAFDPERGGQLTVTPPKNPFWSLLLFERILP